MKSYSLTHLPDHSLELDLRASAGQERGSTARFLAPIAEFDSRGLYRPAGYPSMRAYCMDELHLSEDSASKRIYAGRAARQFPVIFAALADGRLHLSAVVLLAPHLTAENAEGLLAAAFRKSKSEIEQLLAERFLRSESLALVETLYPPASGDSGAERTVEQHAPGHVASRIPKSKAVPIAPQRYAMHFNVGQSAHHKFQYVAQLLSHQVRPGDLAEVFEGAMNAAIRDLEKRKFAATSKPRKGQQRPVASAGQIPASVQRAVWERDRGQCTFVSEKGRRCAARTRLEFDHVEPVARGGSSTVGNVRLLCRAHNQYQAERTYGPAFMKTKREDSARAAAKQRVEEVIPYLRALGCSPGEARKAAERCETIPNASLQERVRLAVSQLGPRPQRPALWVGP